MSNQDTGIFKTGDLVIGSTDPGKSVYSATGSKLIADGVSIYGNESALKDQRKEFVTSVMRNGGMPLLPSDKTSKKKFKSKKSKPLELPPQMSIEEYLHIDSSEETREPAVDEKPVQLQTVQFENSFGKMKAKVEHVVEHEQAFMLVFSDEDSVVFEPKIGETLILHTPGRYTANVYYPGVTFNSPDTSKKFMILFKMPEEEQE